MLFVKPIEDLFATHSEEEETTTLSWSAPDESVDGYRVYVADYLDGEFTPLHSGLRTETSITVKQSNLVERTYLVRAVKETATLNGTYNNTTYTNASTGQFAVVDATQYGGGGGGGGMGMPQQGEGGEGSENDNEPASVTFIGSDRSTRGNWVGHYGSLGYSLAGSSFFAPSFVITSMFDELEDIWDEESDNLGALEDTEETEGPHVAAAWTSTTSFEINLDFSDNAAHRVSLYFLDYSKMARSQRIDIIDAHSGEVIQQHQVNDFAKGKYLTWDISGDVTIRITNTRGPNAVVSGVFFDAPAE